MEESFLSLPRPRQDGMFPDVWKSLEVGGKIRRKGFQEKKMEEKERCQIRRRMTPEAFSLLPDG